MMQEPVDLRDDDEPISEVRTIDVRVRRLVVDTGLRGSAAAAAWVTISDEAGALLFEGSPSDDGCVDVAIEATAQACRRARILLETPRSHRQAVIDLRDGWNAHAFKA